MSSPSLEQRLQTLIGDAILQLGPDFTVDSDLYECGLDSMAIMQLLLLIEEEFSLSIPVESVSRKNFQSVRAIADLLREKTGEAAPAAAAPAPAPEPPKPAAAPVAEIPINTEPILTDPDALPLLRGCDYFVLSFDTLSRATGQGGHKAHSFLELDQLPDIELLRKVLKKANDSYPVLTAKLKRQRPWSTPGWVKSTAHEEPELRLYSETGSPGKLAGATPCADAHQLAEEIVNIPLPLAGKTSWPKSRFAVIETRNGGALFIFSWSHLMMDGVGAEFFLQELQRLSGGSASAPIPPLDDAPPAKRGLRWETVKPIVDFFQKLVEKKFDCLGPRKAVPGPTRFLVHTLTPEQTQAVSARCVQMCGALVSMPFYLACATRAHEALFARRGKAPPTHVCSVPVQTRRKGALGPIFQNHVTMFFGAVDRKDVGSVESATAALMEQHARFIKDRLGESLNQLMLSMSFFPPKLYMKFIALQMRGPFASFFHSHTGEFAAGMNTFFGGKVLNAWHVPGIATPPGTGIFCNEKNGRLVITMCWHENALDESERQVMLDYFLADLGAK